MPEIDMLFIDGNHDYPAVKEDFEDWVPRLAKGGILAMHDVFATPFDGHYDGPWKVLEQHVLNKPEWKWFRLIDTLAVVQRC
jgi:predicted O-methyltransferase YrrM